MPEESTTPDLVELTRGAFEAVSRREIVRRIVHYWEPGRALSELGVAG